MNIKNSILLLGCLLSVLASVQGCATADGHSKAATTTRSLQLTQSSVVAHTVAPHERLGDIALKYTGTATNWQALAKYNRITDPHKIRIGSSIKIPPVLLLENYLAVVNHNKLPTNSAAATSSLAMKKQVTSTQSTTRTIAQSRQQGSVLIHTVPTSRSFKLTPLKKAGNQVQSSKAGANVKVKVIGTYYPKGVYQQPANYSNLILRASPGTLFELEYLANEWYKVVTSEGVGYLREADGTVVMNDKKI